MANIITGCRIICCIALMFCPVNSIKFIVFYFIAGFTDMIDGAVARKMNTVSEFGSKLDSIADFIFVVICMIKIIPILNIPIWLGIWIGVIALIRFINIISGFIVNKKIVAEHTIMNKITGLLLFFFPISLLIIDMKYSAVMVCIVATYAAIDEGFKSKLAN